MRRRLLPAALLGAVLLAAGCSSTSIRPGQAAIVGGRAIKVSQLDKVIKAGPQGRSAADNATQARTVLDAMIRTRLLLAEADAEHVSIGDAEVDAQLANLKAQVAGQGQDFDKAMAQNFFTLDTLRDQLRAQIFVSRVAVRLVPGSDTNQALQQQANQELQRWYQAFAAKAQVVVNPRFGRWDPTKATIVDRDTATVPPPTTAPANPLPGGVAPGQG